MALAREASAGKAGGLPEGNIAEIRIEGNTSITPEQIRGRMKSRVDRPLDRAVIEEDFRALEAHQVVHRGRDLLRRGPQRQGRHRGHPGVRDASDQGRPVHRPGPGDGPRQAQGHRGGHRPQEGCPGRLRQGPDRRPPDPDALRGKRATRRPRSGSSKGGKVGDTRVVIEIFEGPKFKIESIDFVGNSFVDDGVLATKIESRRGFFGLLGARRHKESLSNDRRALAKYYQDNGFFDVKVSATTKPGKELGQEQITFTISEGVQYKVRNIVIEGNKQLPEAKLREGMLVKVGQPYNETMRDARSSRI